MISIIYSTIIYSLVFLLLFTLGEFLYHVLKIKGEFTRKFVHMSSGAISLTFPFFLENHWQVLFLNLSFVTILIFSMLLNLLPSINNVRRITYGTIIFPMVIYLCYFSYHITNDLIYFYPPIIVLAFGDPIASIIGKSFPILPYTNFGYTKTVSGSLGFFFTALISSYIMLEYLHHWTTEQNYILAFAISGITTITESYSHRGYDNLTIPVSTITVIALFNNFIFV